MRVVAALKLSGECSSSGSAEPQLTAGPWILPKEGISLGLRAKHPWAGSQNTLIAALYHCLLEVPSLSTLAWHSCFSNNPFNVCGPFLISCAAGSCPGHCLAPKNLPEGLWGFQGYQKCREVVAVSEWAAEQGDSSAPMQVAVQAVSQALLLASLPALLAQLSWAEREHKRAQLANTETAEQWQSWHLLVSRFSSLQPSFSFNISNTNTSGHLYLQIGTQGTKGR